MTLNFSEIKINLLTECVDVRQFTCRKRAHSSTLENFLRRHAIDNQKKQLSVTWVATMRDVPIGYFSLACASIDLTDLTPDEKDDCPLYDRYPAIIIGKFAVDDRYQQQGVGPWMMEHLYAIIIRLLELVGCRYIIVESKPASVGFYEDRCRFVNAKTLDNGNVLLYKNAITITKEAE